MDRISHFTSIGTSKVPQKSETYLKYKKQSKEDLKNLSSLIKPLKKTNQYPSDGNMGIGKLSQPNCPLEEVQPFRNKSLMKPYKRKKMSEDTYPESKESLANYSKKQKKNLASKKGRKETKQYIGDGNMFKMSKEKKLDFSLNDSPSIHKNFGYAKDRLRGSIQRIRRELIQDDSDDEINKQKVSKETDQANKQHATKTNALRDSVCYESYESNPLQRIIEQRKLESSTDSEESEDELDDDYDIGIDDIELPTEGNHEDHDVYSLSSV